MNETTASERERFEAWALNVGWHIRDLIRAHSGDYREWGTQKAWQGWNARAALPAPADQPPSQEAREYPPLPEPFDKLIGHEDEGACVYSADQMRSYVDADRKARQQEAARYMPIMGTPLAMPFDLLDEQQAQINHSQSLTRLAERGGLGPSEALAIVKRERWGNYQHMKQPDVLSALVAAIAKGEQSHE